MKVTIIEVPTPSVHEFTMFAEPNIEMVKETQKVRVQVSKETKTRIHTSLQIGMSTTGINFAVDGVKTAEKREHSYFTGNWSVYNFFVRSKKQDLEAYKKYVEAVVIDVITNVFHLELDELTIELESANFHK